MVAVPLEGPVVRLVGRPGRNNAHLTWTEIPLDRRQGFITNYTIFCTSGTEKHSMYLSHGVQNQLEILHLQISVNFSVTTSLTSLFLFCSFAGITVPGNITSYTLRLLSGNTKYDVCIMASTVRGSANSTNHSFTTLKYG